MRRIKVKKKKANRNAILIEKFDFQNFSWVNMNKNLLSAVYKPDTLTTELYIWRNSTKTIDTNYLTNI